MAGLEGVRVIDFTTLLPGPLATLMMAECGADVIKIERPGVGDEMRTYGPHVHGQSVPFMMLNRGKRSLTLDLKDSRDLGKALALIQEADVLVEQFRPGVMDALGLGYEAIKMLNPEIIYCSITGYGQEGVHARTAGHDMNYAAETGLLLLNTGPGEKPSLPHVPIADIAAGSYPALINILLALRRRSLGGGGLHLDIAMAQGLAPLMYGAMARLESPLSADDRTFTGGSPRYQLYETSDAQYLAVAAVEDRFWQTFCSLVNIDVLADIKAVAACIAQNTGKHWETLLAGSEACCSLVRSVTDYCASPLFVSTGRLVHLENAQVNELPLPIAPELRTRDQVDSAPVMAPAGAKITWL